MADHACNESSSTTHQFSSCSHARLAHRRDADVGRLARDWESAILDIRDLAAINATFSECFLSEVKPTLSASQVRQMTYVAYELANKIEAFRDAFYAAVELK